MADITLVPERRVLQRRQEIAAHHTRKPADALAQDGIALVRHRGAPLLLLAERLERLSDLGALEVADLDRDPLQRPGGDRERRHEARVAVARHDLSRNFIDLQTKLAADLLLDPPVDGGVGSPRPPPPADGRG